MSKKAKFVGKKFEKLSPEKIASVRKLVQQEEGTALEPEFDKLLSDKLAEEIVDKPSQYAAERMSGNTFSNENFIREETITGQAPVLGNLAEIEELPEESFSPTRSMASPKKKEKIEVVEPAPVHNLDEAFMAQAYGSAQS